MTHTQLGERADATSTVRTILYVPVYTPTPLSMACNSKQIGW